MTGRVEGKVAFITGAARGQGRSHAVTLAREGADIIAVDILGEIVTSAPFHPPATEDDLARTVAAVEALDRRILATRADVRDFAALRQVLDAGIAEFGRIDIIVANAGIFPHGSLLHEVDEREWDEIFDINVKGAWLTCKAAIPHLIKQGDGGSITLINSTAGLKGIPTVGPYTASKHGLVGLMRTLALELAPHWIRVRKTPKLETALPPSRHTASTRRPWPRTWFSTSAPTGCFVPISTIRRARRWPRC